MPSESQYQPTVVQPASECRRSRHGDQSRVPANSPEVAASGAISGAPDTHRGKHSDSTAEIVFGSEQLARATSHPVVGADFEGFHLLEEVGRGTFSRVYLARQPGLADRHVVVKVTTDGDRESNTLARLRHANIVPVYSAHRLGKYHVVCMPFLGTATLADVYRGLENMSSLPDVGIDLFSTLRTRSAATLSGRQPIPGDRPPTSSPAIALLAGRSYVEAVLWLAARLADALAHAHDCGVVHRDLKPANILLADDGQPMLLDFNLATTAAADGSRGGTPLYMSPEQIAGFTGTPRAVDGRSDLYSLGVILYELLTRRSPHPRYKQADPESLRAMLADRATPQLRPWNRAVSPAVEAVVRRCLEPDPARRYQSAHDLKTDLDRHLAHLPLAHTPEPSRRERARKWLRRNRPRAVAAGVLAVAAVVSVSANAAVYSFSPRPSKSDAKATARDFTADAQTAVALLLDGTDSRRPDEGAERGEAALARYGVLTRPDWWTDRAVQNLDRIDQARLRDQAGELLALLARVTASRAVLNAGHADPKTQLLRSLSLNSAARACYSDGREPQGVRDHRAELLRLTGQPHEAALRDRLPGVSADRASDRLIRAERLLSRGDHRNALPLLRELSRDDPGHVAGWYLLGICHAELGQHDAAAGCFSSCIALRPDFACALYNRGRAMRKMNDTAHAQADFDRAKTLRPETPSSDAAPIP